MNIEEIKERLNKASQGPWKFEIVDDGRDTDCGGFLDATGIRIMDFGDSEQYYPSSGDAPSGYDINFIENAYNDIEYLLSIIEQQNEILKSLAYTVLADFTHMSEYHINSTIVELANKAEKLCNMDIKSRATNEVVSEHWNLED